MSLFDLIISQTREKFDVSAAEAGGLLSTLVTAILDEENGGFAGFLELFRQAGLGDTATSWVHTGANTPLSYEQTESVFGEETLEDIAAEVGMDYETTTSATAFMVPHIVDKLTPEGEVPDEQSLNKTVGGFLAGAAATVAAETSTAAAETAAATDAERAPIEETMTAAADAESDVPAPADIKQIQTAEQDTNSILKWLIPLMLLALLVFVLYMSCGEAPPPAANPPAGSAKTTEGTSGSERTENGPAPVAARAVNSSFSLRAENGRYFVSGIVRDEETKKRITDALSEKFGQDSVDFTDLRVDADARPFPDNWWDHLSRVLPEIEDWRAGELSFVGSTLTVANNLPTRAIARIKDLFGGEQSDWRLPPSVVGAETAAKQANEAAAEKLDSARSFEEVVAALNETVINFPSGGAKIPADELGLLDKAAATLKKQTSEAAAGKTIEIAGHTDSDGNDEMNMKLSRERAEAVKSALIERGVSEKLLVARGYGETRPKVPNTSPDNKFMNRRIEYKVAGENTGSAENSSSE